MENEYSVVTANKFNLFLDEGEPADVLESLQEAKSKKKDEKTSNAKSSSAKTEKAKGNKVLTPAQDQKVNEIKPKTDDNKKDNKSGKARNEGDRENRRPQSARENVPPRRQQQQQQSGEQRPDENRERRPQQGFGGPDRRRGGGGFRGDRTQLSGDREEGGNFQQRDRPPRDNNRGFGDREGSGFQHDRPPRDNRRFRGGRPPRRGGDWAGFGGEGRPHGQNGAENTDQLPPENRPNTADGAVEGGDAGRKPWPESSGEVQEGGFGDRRGGRVFRRGGGGGYRGGRGRGGYGGSRGGYDRYGKREFDRHSGDDRSGVRAVDKRAGGGAHNWGKTDDELANSEETAAEKRDWSEDVPRRDWAAESERADEANKEGDENAGGDGETAAEDEKEMTYAEYKALQEKERSANARAAFNVRKPNEGHEDASWKKMVQLKKEVDDGEPGEEEEQDEEEHEDADKHGRGGKRLDIHFTLPDRHHGDGERGPRRGGRGGYGGSNREGRGRGAPYRGNRGGGGYGGRGGYYDDNRGGAPRRGGQAPKFDDNEFPALS